MREADLDVELIKCDTAIISIYALGKATVDTVTHGHFSPNPSVTAQDLVDISHAFNDAASASMGWLVAGALLRNLGVFRRPLDRDRRRAAALVLAVFAIGGPLGVLFKVTALAAGVRGHEALLELLISSLLELPAKLAVIVAWRLFIAPALML